MKKPLEAVRVSGHVYWVGAIDWDLRDFHGYATARGTTYNAYLVLAEKIALIDTVRAPYVPELLSRIASVIDPEDIDIVVSNHSEMDHSGGLPEIVATVRPERVYASAAGVKALSKHFHGGPEVTPVKDGERLSLGDASLTFLETRMLHWPDSMFSYLDVDQVLFSQDAFGMHLASAERFDDEIDAAVMREEATRYYANILMPFSPLVTKLLERVKELALPTRVVAPDHGPIWRRDFGRIAGWYGAWAKREPTRKVVITYDTMWGSTAKMARAIADGAAGAGASPRVLPLRASTRADVATEVLEAGALVVGSPTINRGMFPTVADVLCYLKGLKPAGLIGASFGSYGWSGEAVGEVHGLLEEMKVELISPGVRTEYVPTEQALMECRELGQAVARRLL
jgi:flavorubredoxin